MKTIMYALWFGLTCLSLWLNHFAAQRIGHMKREIHTLQQEKQDLRYGCPETIQRPEAPNGSN